MVRTGFPQRTARDWIIRWPNRASALALCAGLQILLGSASDAAAQDRQTTPNLEDLIPDSAVENPEDWATETLPAVPLDQDVIEPEPDTPISEVPGAIVPWPTDIAIEGFEPLEPEEEVVFADLETDAPDIAFADAEIERLGDNLVLAFPQKEPPFTERGDFVDRFAALSTIEELESDDESIAQLGARARSDEDLLANLLRVYGYYDGEIIRSVGVEESPTETSAATDPTVRFDIIPGPRYRYGAIDLGNLDSAPDYASLRETFAIQSGDFLQSDVLVQQQFALDEALGETGYAFAEIAAPRLLIDHARSEGDLTLTVQPNGKYVFGEVTSDDPQFLSGEHLGSIARFEPGDIYQRSLELDLRRAIAATSLVSSIEITPREVSAPNGDEPGIVALDVGLTPAKLRTISGAIGYGAEEGVRVQAAWEHRNLFPPEGMLRVRAILGTREQLGGVTFRKNNFTGRDKVLTLDTYARAVDTEAYDANTVAVRGTFEKLSTLLFQKPFSWGLGAEILATDERNRVFEGIPLPRQTYFIGSVFARGTVDTSDSLLDPTTGYRLTGFVSPEFSQTAGRSFQYVRLQGDASYYRRASDRIVLAGRLRAATIQGAELFGIAPSRRLYAGGGSSVRGYGYETVGPRDELGQPLGGRSLVEASIEARIQTGLFDDSLSVVPFFDAGAVSISPTPDFRFVKYGAGVGIRYLTSFGPIRVDVGTPLNPEPTDSPVAVYVSLGQAF
ncbi:outer membrane protein assembly factor [Erythrobacter litoralis]|uniref:autotransporter assembly complex protein TamA n=1 Tax=Erythrobacter litoralis TaxID=39960 RepID=UPI00243599F0|nr:BamA/TamA family outer membrane protein [Erythrobacter litoralis]MDG6077665.1 outer membrane protein assembly factor [Erythrobacter litoralis]